MLVIARLFSSYLGHGRPLSQVAKTAFLKHTFCEVTFGFCKGIALEYVNGVFQRFFFVIWLWRRVGKGGWKGGLERGWRGVGEGLGRGW